MVCFCGSVGNRLWIVFVEFEMPRLKGVFDDVISTSFSWSVCHKADRGTPQIRALERQRRKKTGDGMKGGRRGSSFRYLPWITPAFSSTSCTQCTTGPIVWLEAVAGMKCANELRDNGGICVNCMMVSTCQLNDLGNHHKANVQHVLLHLRPCDASTGTAGSPQVVWVGHWRHQGIDGREVTHWCNTKAECGTKPGTQTQGYMC